MRPVTARILLLVTAALFSTGGAAIKLCELNSFQIAAGRSGVAGLFLLLVLPASRRFLHPKALLVGVAHGATMMCFVTANKLTTSANTIFLQSCAPLYVLLLAPLLLREPIRRRDIGFLLLLIGGMALLFLGEPDPSATAPDPGTGNLLAVGSGIGWAFTLMGMRWLARSGGVDASASVVAGNVIACSVCLPMALPLETVQVMDVAVVVFLGVFQIALAYVLMVRALPYVPAFEASLLLLLEAVLNPIWSFLLHDEGASAPALAGGGVILVTLAVRAGVEARMPSAVTVSAIREGPATGA